MYPEEEGGVGLAADMREIGRSLQDYLPAKASRHDRYAVMDPVRFGAARAAAAGALNIEKSWKRSPKREGPVDVIDLFSGCGGLSSGFRAANGLVPAYRPALAIDIDEVSNRTYESNLGLSPVNIDVAVLAREKKKWEQLVSTSRRREGHPLVLVGCAPCQGFSSHRNSWGQSDERNSLFLDFAKIVRREQPDAVVAENVPEILAEKYWPYVQQARRILESDGYFVHIGIHNLAEYGLPQERFRAVLIAMRKPFLAPEGFLGRPRFRTVRDAIGKLPPVRAGERSLKDPLHYSAGHKESTLEVIRAVPRNGGSRPPHMGPQCLTRIHDRQGRSGYDDVYGRLRWDKPAITITAYARNPASGRFVHPEQDRGLSIREAALLQGFPSSYWFSGTLDERFRQIGNAVPPIFAAYLALYLLGELFGPKISPQHFNRGILNPVGTSFSRLIPALKNGASIG